MNFNLLLEQVLFENELVLIAEQAQVIADKLKSLSDFADTANQQASVAKQTTNQTGEPLDVKELLNLRKKLMELVSIARKWPNNMSPSEKDQKLDDYILSASTDASSVVGLQGEQLPANLNLRGLRYLHRRWIAPGQITK